MGSPDHSFGAMVEVRVELLLSSILRPEEDPLIELANKNASDYGDRLRAHALHKKCPNGHDPAEGTLYVLADKDKIELRKSGFCCPEFAKAVLTDWK